MIKRFYTNKYVLFATYEIINFDNYTSENKTKHSRSPTQNINNWRLRIWKKKLLLSSIENRPDIDKIYLYAKDSNESKYQYF